MNGYSSHTYKWVNASGEAFLVKYHFKTNQGIKCMKGPDAEMKTGQTRDYA
jgi:catalase